MRPMRCRNCASRVLTHRVGWRLLCRICRSWSCRHWRPGQWPSTTRWQRPQNGADGGRRANGRASARPTRGRSVVALGTVGLGGILPARYEKSECVSPSIHKNGAMHCAVTCSCTVLSHAHAHRGGLGPPGGGAQGLRWWVRGPSCAHFTVAARLSDKFEVL